MVSSPTVAGELGSLFLSSSFEIDQIQIQLHVRHDRHVHDVLGSVINPIVPGGEPPAVNPHGSEDRAVSQLNYHGPATAQSPQLDCLSCPDLGDQLPVQTESGPVPTHHRFRRDHNEGLLPSGPKSTNGDPEELVEQV
jgi:hypothetical protein